MPISNLTAAIIQSRDDVECNAGGPDPATGKYVGWITLGPEDRYRPLLNTSPEYDSKEAAKEAMEKLVLEIRNNTQVN